MRLVIEDRLLDVHAFDGSAEAIPLETGVADAVVVGNPFHHFHAERAFAEIRRVLRPGGALAVLGVDSRRHVWLISRTAESRRGRRPCSRGVKNSDGDCGCVPELDGAANPSPGLHALRAGRVPYSLFNPVGAARRAVRDVKRRCFVAARQPHGLQRIREFSREFPAILELPVRAGWI